MSKKEMKNSKTNSKLIICKNCRQEILEDKMFLHEGFCLRNNVFCEHCEKVFLKNDYDDHIKNIPKNLTKMKKSDSQSQSQKSPETCSESGKLNSVTEHNDSMNTLNDNIESLYPTPSLEFVQMPPTELFHINNPIIISENGKIVSSKNKNEYLLPYLGINPMETNPKTEEILDEMINQGEIFKENNTISRNSYKIEDLQKLLSKDSINSNNRSNINNSLNFRDSNSSNISVEQNKDKKNLRLNNHIHFYNENRGSKSKSFINNVNYTDSNAICNNPNNLNNNINDENNSINSNIIINNNIITYNSNKNISKIHNFYNKQETPHKNSINNSLKKSIPNNPIDKNSIKSQSIQINESFNNKYFNNYSGNKEPKDSNSKKNQCYQLSGEKIPQNKEFKPQSAKSGMGKKRCEFCNYIFSVGEINNHYKKCKFKKEKKKKIRKFDIPKPTKKDKLILPEKLNTLANEEFEIGDSKREKLNREFNTALNVISLNNVKKVMRENISNPEKRNRKINLLEPKKIALKKKLFNEVKEKKDFPEDSIRVEKNAKTQLREYRNKRLNNMSVDNNDFNLLDCFGKGIKIIKSPNQPLNCEEFDPWLFFHNSNEEYNKTESMGRPKIKKFIRNSYKV